MSSLQVQEIAGAALAIEYVNHAPIRTAVFGGSVSGSFSPGDAITFSPSGATGLVETWSGGTKTLTFYLLEGTPALGDTVTASGGSVTALSALDLGGDTFSNDGRTYLFVDNHSLGDVTVIVIAAAECSYGYKHDLAVTIGAGLSGPVGPFDRRRFNQPGGLVQVTYAGSTTPSDLGVAAVRMFPSS